MSKYGLAFIAALLLTASVYWIGLDGPLVFDDTQNLAPIKGWLAGEQSWLQVIFGNTSGALGRPISMASFVLNVALLGPTVWGLKLGNLAIHLITGMLVYALFSGLLRRGMLTREPSAAARWMPTLGAAIWLLHPLLVSTVLYVVQRMAMLSSLFMLAAMLAYVHGRNALDAGEWRRAKILLTSVPLWTIAAIFSKENGILALPLCALIEWLAFAPAKGHARKWWSRAILIAFLLAPALLAISLTLLQSPSIFGEYANRPFSLYERLLTQTRVLWSYVSSLLVPFGPRLGLYHDDYRLSHGLLDPVTTSAAIAAWVLLLASAWHLRRRVPGFALGAGIFLLGHSIESSVFPLLMYFEHRNYLPAVGAIWALLSLAFSAGTHLKREMHHGTAIFTGSAIALLLVFTTATAARVSVWQSQQAMFAQGLAYHPTSRWLRTDLAQSAMQRTPPDVALARHHIDVLAVSDDEETRRLAGVWQLLIDCGSGNPAHASSISLAFDGHADIIQADTLTTLEALSDGIQNKPCAGLNRLQMADALTNFLDSSNVQADHFHVRRLRYKAAQLYLASGSLKKASHQARAAYSGSSEDAPMGALLVNLEIADNRLVEAAKLLDTLKTQVPARDQIGREVLANLTKRLDEARRRNDSAADR
ncbi:MAG TPA: hypothetical protein VFN29_01985 [Chiayiivirga sp.]|nr:hypothetical protein [Chiayiivirga sp.]